MEAMKFVGMEVFWPNETVPTGWLEENGASLLRANYPALFAVIGTMYGAADETHFNLPDMRGRFVRVWDHSRALDPNRATRTKPSTTGATLTAGDHVGTEQAEAYLSHRHGIGSTVVAASVSGTVNNASANASVFSMYSGGDETRPVNTYRMMIIRAY